MLIGCDITAYKHRLGRDQQDTQIDLLYTFIELPSQTQVFGPKERICLLRSSRNDHKMVAVCK